MPLSGQSRHYDTVKVAVGSMSRPVADGCSAWQVHIVVGDAGNDESLNVRCHLHPAFIATAKTCSHLSERSVRTILIL